jgi:carbamoyltransferase
MKILGLSFGYHDSAAAYIENGVVKYAIEEERLSRVKHDSRFPKNAINYIFQKEKITASELDIISYYENPYAKLERILAHQSTSLQQVNSKQIDTVAYWVHTQKLDVAKFIRDGINSKNVPIHYLNHHLSHASSSFFSSNFHEATIITIDGVGENTTASICIGRENKITKLVDVDFPNSLGLLYSGFTAFLGFEINEGEYKVMGMAGYGKPIYKDEILKCFKLYGDGSFKLDQKWFDFNSSTQFFSDSLIKLFGDPRDSAKEFLPGRYPKCPDEKYADIAASIQYCTEEVVLHVVRSAIAKSGIRNVCLAGGVALNSVANGRLQRELQIPVYVHPAAGDSGSALGAAQYWSTKLTGSRPIPVTSPYLGPEYNDDEIQDCLIASGLKFEEIPLPSDMVTDAARLLATGSVIGWFQGRAEWGPRALGARSILASPIGPEMKTRVNERVKFRETFRPFAPSVLEEEAENFFHISDIVMHEQSPEHYMISIANVREEWKDKIPAVVHVDGTARVQLVNKFINSYYYDLIFSFNKITQIPILLNTSFNLKGEAIVGHPLDAIQTFLYSDIDALYMGGFKITKNQN